MDENAPEIQVDCRTHIRKRPAMYFGWTSSRGVVQVINELVSNGIDLFLKGTASRVGISVAGETITYTDDGPGLPYDLPGPGNLPLAEHYLTNFHNSPTADNHAPHIHLNGLGLGMMPVNVVSEFFEVKTWRSGCLWAQRFQQGSRIEPAQIVERGTGKGTTVWFELDGKVFSEKLPARLMLRKLMFEAAHLFPGITLELGTETFFAPNGLADLANLYYTPKTYWEFNHPEPFGLNVRSGDIQVNVGLAGETTSVTVVRSWANGSSTALHGTHVSGLQDAFHFAQWKPAVAMIHVVMYDPQFAGPTKCQLSNPEVRKSVRECLKPALQVWCEQQRRDRAK